MTCDKCEYFRQHYRRTNEEDRIAWVNCGHCTQGRVRHRAARASACEHFQERPEAPERKRIKRARAPKKSDWLRLAI